MLNKKWIICLAFWAFCLSPCYAQDVDELGQNLQINASLNAIRGTPTWLIEIRDIDHNQTIPYLFNLHRGDNSWIVFTYSRNYLITASRLQFESYRNRSNTFKNYRINNFCNIESNGRISRGKSISIYLSGSLSPNNDTYNCQVSSFPDANFSIVESETE